MGCEPARVVHGATGDDETHGGQRYSTTGARRDFPIRRLLSLGARSTGAARACPSLRPFVIGRLCSQSPGAAPTARLPWKQEVAARARCVVAPLPCP
ncbi:hypothetical protein P376_5217 [Streptomyces sp. HCCB10043]|nr:hypothetical protein P376_5217 [Streptomyces sp. HCCB10043]EWS94558.1 hypothetical protein SSIG_05219 [Streptomyces filamentosus NRRL 11379]